MVAFSTLNGHLLQKTMTTITMHSPHFLYPNSSTNNINPILLSLPILSPPSRNPIITCARTTTNKGFFRSKQSRQTLFQLLRFTASHLPYMLPDPLNSLIREFGLGSGSGSGSGSGGGNWKGFGWGGFDGGGGRKRRVNNKSQFWLLGFVIVCCLGFWWLNLGGRIELKNDVVLGAICLCMFLVLVKNGCVPDWVLGFCGGGVVVGVLGDKRGELKKVVKGLVEMMMGGSRRQRRRRRGV